MSMTIGILTAGGDSPGLNAAIRGVGKAALRAHGMHVIGFLDGFRGLMQNRKIRLDSAALSGILIKGGTILGTSRDKPHKMDIGGKVMDMTDLIVENVEANGLDALVCLGGGGTAKNALRLSAAGVPVVMLPKTIDNDVAGTDVTFGFDTALGIATEAIDRLHSTAHSHHRIIVVEVMGHNTGWLALGAGLAGGADVILLPEIPYDRQAVADTILARKAAGNSFSIVVVSEGAASIDDMTRLEELTEALADDAAVETEDVDSTRSKLESELAALKEEESHSTDVLAHHLEHLTGLEARVTILGHVQRGGTPSSADRLLATTLGTAAVDLIADGVSGVMVGIRDGQPTPVPLDEVAGNRKTVPLDHRWFAAARALQVGFGD